MIYKQTKLKIVDNSGAKIIKVFQLLKYSSSQNYSQSGDLVLGSIISYKVNKKVSKKQMCRVLLITSKKNIQRTMVHVLNLMKIEEFLLMRINR